jgi:colanic acid biosynthesis glycosyl transferase WcaI
VQELACQPSLRQELGARGRAWAEENLARDAVLGQFEAALRECVAGARRR